VRRNSGSADGQAGGWRFLPETSKAVTGAQHPKVLRGASTEQYGEQNFLTFARLQELESSKQLHNVATPTRGSLRRVTRISKKLTARKILRLRLHADLFQSRRARSARPVPPVKHQATATATTTKVILNILPEMMKLAVRVATLKVPKGVAANNYTIPLHAQRHNLVVNIIRRNLRTQVFPK